MMLRWRRVTCLTGLASLVPALATAAGWTVEPGAAAIVRDQFLTDHARICSFGSRFAGLPRLRADRRLRRIADAGCGRIPCMADAD
jgi:hypothetical protein